METLSRREEDALLKATKAKALKECDPIVKGAFRLAMVFSSFTAALQTLRTVLPGAPCRLHGRAKPSTKPYRIAWHSSESAHWSYRELAHASAPARMNSCRFVPACSLQHWSRPNVCRS